MSRLAAVIGSPVAHSLSPAIHRAAFAAAGRDWSYVAFDVAAGRADEALAAMRLLGIAGFSVTTPHKEQVAAAVDELDPAAANLRSVNTVTLLPGGRLHGASTDGAGLLAALGADGVELGGRRVVVLGAGAAARSVVDAIGRVEPSAGAPSDVEPSAGLPVANLAIVNRTAERARAVAELAPGAEVATDAASAVSAADVVINATSIGFGTDDTPAEGRWLHTGQVVVDLVYHPLETALLRAATAAGARAVDGLGMLIHQAALQQQIWTGEFPDVAAMRAAAEAALAARC